MENKVFEIGSGTISEISPSAVEGLTITFCGGNNNIVRIAAPYRFSNTKIIVDGCNNCVYIDENCTLINTTVMCNGSSEGRKVHLKTNVYIGGAFMQLLGKNDVIEVGGDCMFSNGIYMSTDEKITIYDKDSGEIINKGGKIIIGNHVWIGRDVYICGGVNIVDDVIIGIKSVVTNNILERNISVGGNPTKKIGEGVGFLKCAMENFEIMYKAQNKASAIVTGANGFVGRWLVNELVENNVKVIAVIKDENEDVSMFSGRRNVEIVYCELCSIKKLTEKIKSQGFDAFYHLAWVGSGGALRADYNVQLENAKYSCDAAMAAKELGCKKFLAAGTITEEIVDSTLTANAVSQNMMYGISKKTVHLMLNALCLSIGLDFVWMQFSNIYGPNNLSGNLISYTMTELINGRRPAFSKGEQPYDFIYIKDLVHAAYLLGFVPTKHRDYFLGSGNSRKLCEYLSQIPEILGETFEVGIGERPEDGVVYKPEWFDNTLLAKDTGFIAKYSFEEGIKETFRWIKSAEQ